LRQYLSLNTLAAVAAAIFAAVLVAALSIAVDWAFSFASLGALGVGIEMYGPDRLKKRFKERPTPATQEPYWAVGRIRYNAADGGGTDGLLLFFKSGLHGTEPMDVLSYAMTHPTFPHETTANQFFTESQFESYRMLGFEIVGRALESGGYSALAAATPAEDAAPGRAVTADLTLDLVIKNLENQLVARVAGC
jgi:hypothetical protein